MKHLSIRNLAAGVVGLLTLGCVHQPPPYQTEDRIRELVAREAQAELAMWRSSFPAITETQIELERIEPAIHGTEIWNARIPLDHWHRYVVAHHNGKIWKLGGFAQPELQQFSAEVGLGGASSSLEDAKRLIGLADPNGSNSTFVSELDTGHPLHQAWLAAREPAWPVDTMVAVDTTASLVRLTVLSNVQNSYDQPWTPYVYTFLFGRDTRLIAWTRREGRTFQ